MTQAESHLGVLRALTWDRAALVVAVLVGCGLLVQLARQVAQRAAESVPSRHRLLILRATPFARLLIGLAGFAIIIPLLVEPTFENVVALLATVTLALAFALKDYVSCLIAGLVTILENPYQPGDWIEFDGTYGEVRAIGTRAVRLATADDNEVIIPHARLWSARVVNASGGQPSVLVVTHFYLVADHDGDAVSKILNEIAQISPHRKPQSAVQVRAAETPFGTHYKLKAYAAESRQQFAMATELTLRAKERLRAMGVTYARTPYARSGV